ncbi:tail fiber domain-containing protein [Clostridioides sp. ES-S-0190-01]|uniref:tail fiber domain-containing protein n=1 Tax=Clostridioides sp. ES-S-0190-01 TaxID=2770787 RepID=UPI001D1272CA|nr:tail fiber domain-containing protein [Clostridioides sp. ES-S-0190-01]
MAIYDNSYTLSYIRITGCIVTYNEEVYTVQDESTNRKYIYWNANNPYKLETSNLMLDRSNTRFLIVINDNGIHTEVPNDSDIFSINYDGDSQKNIEKEIYALYETDKKLGDRFISVEKDLDGIRQTVGDVKEYTSYIKENISVIDQKADNINIFVKEATKNFNDSKELSKLREDTNNLIIKLNSDLGLFNSNINEYFRDDEITDIEKTQISTQISLLDTDKSNLYTQIQKIIDRCQSNSDSTSIAAINSSKTALDNAHNNLKTIINSVISDNIITPSDVILVTNGFAKYNLKVNELKNTLDGVFLKGMGGSVSEEFAQINVKANEIALSVKKLDTNVGEMSSEIRLMAGEIASKVSEGDISSIIRQSPTDIRIGFNKIADSVVINSSGLTVNQGAIACDILTTPSGHEPIIRLFGSSKSGFAIDARKSDGASQASAIRLKYDSNNYFFVGSGSAAIYINAYENYKFGSNDAKFGANKIDVGDDGYTRMDLTGGNFRLYTSEDWDDDNGIVIWKRGAISFMINGEERQHFARNGSKSGAIEINGTTFGMSPVDSPKLLIEDVLFDIEVEETGTIIKLNSIFSQSILNFAIFSSNSNCKIIEKGSDYFKVQGYTGKCDFRIIGKRIGYEHTYYKIMGGEEQHGNWKE